MKWRSRLRTVSRYLTSPKPSWAWVGGAVGIGAVTLGVILAGVFAQDFQDWLIGTDASRETGSTTVRNLGLVIAGLVALYLAVWRGLVAQKQAGAAQQSLRNERYQKGAEMLGSKVLSVRLGGIYALQGLAKDYPEEYHVQIMRLLCGFVRNPTKDPAHEREVAAKQIDFVAREDVQAVLNMMEHRYGREIELESLAQFTLNFVNADLSGVILMDANLAGADLTGANLRKADFRRTDMTGTKLFRADLSGAILWLANLSKADLTEADLFETQLWDANLSGAFLWESNLSFAQLHGADLSNSTLARCNVSGTDFSGKRTFRDLEDYITPSPVQGFTQRQLDLTRPEPNPLPDLEGVIDPEGNEIKWTGGSGAPLKD